MIPQKKPSWLQGNDDYSFKFIVEESEQTTKGRKKKSSSQEPKPERRGFGKFWLFLLCCLLGVGGFSFWAFGPIKQNSRAHQVVIIPYGASLRQVGNLLEKRDLIRNKYLFELYAKFISREITIKAGRYRLDQGMSMPIIVKALQEGTYEGVRVTIPEGLTNKEIADLLSQRGLVDHEKFITVLQDSKIAKEILGEYYQNMTSLEGYLFPDTYEFPINADETEVVKVMLKRFMEVFKTNFADVPVGKVKEILTMASLVEKEAKAAEERTIIAGVFYNRLQRHIRLESCATVQYALQYERGERKKTLTYKDVKIDSPYNTYKNSGLPPGPIANPGIASLTAAVHPEKVDYLYFVAQANGRHIFSATYKQHLEAQRRMKNEQ